MAGTKNPATRIFVRRRDKVFGISNSSGGVNSVTGSAPITSSGGSNPNIAVNDATASTVGVVQPDNTTITISGGIISAVTSTINFADNEVVSGSGVTWTLANTPSPAGSLLLVQHLDNYGGIVLLSTTDYTLAGATITIVGGQTPSSGDLRAWYRY